MRKRAAFRFTLAGALLGITLVSVGAAGTASAEAPIAITISVVNGDGGAVDPGISVNPSGPEGALVCVGGSGTWTCDGTVAGTYSVGSYFGPLGGVTFDAACNAVDGSPLDPAALALDPQAVATVNCVVTYSAAASAWPGDEQVASEAPVPAGDTGGALPSTGTRDIIMIGGFAVLLSAIGAALSTLARRPVR